MSYCGQSKCVCNDSGTCKGAYSKCTRQLDIHGEAIFEGALVYYSEYEDGLELAKNVQDFNYNELALLDCVLVTAIFGCDQRISELKNSNLREGYNRDQLAVNEKSKADYEQLRQRVRVAMKMSETGDKR